jgi:ADP-ribose pyrophosphatase
MHGDRIDAWESAISNALSQLSDEPSSVTDVQDVRLAEGEDRVAAELAALREKAAAEVAQEQDRINGEMEHLKAKGFERLQAEEARLQAEFNAVKERAAEFNAAGRPPPTDAVELSRRVVELESLVAEQQREAQELIGSSRVKEESLELMLRQVTETMPAEISRNREKQLANAGEASASDAKGADVPASLFMLPLQLEGHVKARGQDNSLYPQRQTVPDALVPWTLPFPSYEPVTWTHQDVLDNNRELSTGNKWADPPGVARAALEHSFSYAGDGQPKPLVLDASGTPQNPIGRTGLRGRGLLGKWGPNHAADPIVTRHHPETGKLQMVAIQRKDTEQWAIPGGMVDDGEAVSATLRREFTEEAGNIEDSDARAQFKVQVAGAHSLAATRRTPSPLPAGRSPSSPAPPCTRSQRSSSPGRRSTAATSTTRATRTTLGLRRPHTTSIARRSWARSCSWARVTTRVMSLGWTSTRRSHGIVVSTARTGCSSTASLAASRTSGRRPSGSRHSMSPRTSWARCLAAHGPSTSSWRCARSAPSPRPKHCWQSGCARAAWRSGSPRSSTPS